MNRWVLAFDGSCGSCRRISHAVATAGAGRLEVVPLDRDDVQAWRAAWFGSEPPWTPTLMRLRDDEVVRAWTGTAMAGPLVRELGPRATVRVLHALGELRHAPAAPGRDGLVGRAQFLKLTAGGLAAAAGIVAFGRTPAFADPEGEAARRWVAEHAGRLPTGYDEVVALPMAHRRLTFAASSPAVRSRLWTEQVRRYRSAHPDLNSAQRSVVDRFATLAALPATWERRSAQDRRLHDLRKAAAAAFGRDEAHAAFATLGPPESGVTAAAAEQCSCSSASDFCSDGYTCFEQSGANACTRHRGCGALWAETCDGSCLRL